MDLLPAHEHPGHWEGLRDHQWGAGAGGAAKGPRQAYLPAPSPSPHGKLQGPPLPNSGSGATGGPTAKTRRGWPFLCGHTGKRPERPPPCDSEANPALTVNTSPGGQCPRAGYPAARPSVGQGPGVNDPQIQRRKGPKTGGEQTRGKGVRGAQKTPPQMKAKPGASLNPDGQPREEDLRRW